MYKMKNILIVVFLVFKPLLGQSTVPIDNVDAKFAGLSYVQITNGAGVGGYYEKYFAKSHRMGIETNFIITRGENEYPIYDPYYGYLERSDKKRLSFLNINLKYKKILFVDQIANNFRPFLSLSAGPIIAFDPPNVPELSERFKNIETSLSWNGSAGVGIDFLYSGNSGMSFFAGYNYIKFPNKLDQDPENYKELIGNNGYEYDYGKKDYSSALVRISIIRKF